MNQTPFSVRFLVELRPRSVCNSGITGEHVAALEALGFSFLVVYKPYGEAAIQPISNKPRRDWILAEGWMLRGEYHGTSLDCMIDALQRAFRDRKIEKVSFHHYLENTRERSLKVRDIAVTQE